MKASPLLQAFSSATFRICGVLRGPSASAELLVVTRTLIRDRQTHRQTQGLGIYLASIAFGGKIFQKHFQFYMTSFLITRISNLPLVKCLFANILFTLLRKQNCSCYCIKLCHNVQHHFRRVVVIFGRQRWCDVGMSIPYKVAQFQRCVEQYFIRRVS